MSSWLRRRAIPSGDVAPLRRITVRTHFVALVLAVGACALLAAGVTTARGLDQQRNGLVTGGASTIVVLDLSLSITDQDYRVMRQMIEKLIRAQTPIGLVVFSDIPYELLPPRTPANELRPLLRLLTPTPDGRLPPNPWNVNFTAGTLISAAMQLAQHMLRKNHINSGSILLASDLQTAPTDYDQLGKTLAHLRASSTTVRVVPLSPSSDGVTLFQKILGASAFVNGIRPSQGGVPRVESVLRGRTPLGLLVAGVLLLVALAAHERYAGRLALPRGAGWRAT
jgi:von Willebrand factor type A domain